MNILKMYYYVGNIFYNMDIGYSITHDINFEEYKEIKNFIKKEFSWKCDLTYIEDKRWMYDTGVILLYKVMHKYEYQKYINFFLYLNRESMNIKFFENKYKFYKVNECNCFDNLFFEWYKYKIED